MPHNDSLEYSQFFGALTNPCRTEFNGYTLHAVSNPAHLECSSAVLHSCCWLTLDNFTEPVVFPEIVKVRVCPRIVSIARVQLNGLL